MCFAIFFNMAFLIPSFADAEANNDAILTKTIRGIA
jgi:hypothetical protein